MSFPAEHLEHLWHEGILTATKRVKPAFTLELTLVTPFAHGPLKVFDGALYLAVRAPPRYLGLRPGSASGLGTRTEKGLLFVHDRWAAPAGYTGSIIR